MWMEGVHGAVLKVPTPVPFPLENVHLIYGPGDFPVAENVLQTCLSLPMFPEMTGEERVYAARTLFHLVSGISASVVE